MGLDDNTNSGEKINTTLQGAKDTTTQVVDKAKEQAAPMMDEAKDTASQVAGQVQDQASDIAGQAKEKAKSRLDDGRERAATTLESVAEALHETGQSLGEKEGDYTSALGDYSKTAGDKVNSLAEHLKNNDIDGLMHEAEDFGRRDPALFLGAAFTIGVLGARFLKSSSRQRQNANRSDSNRSRTGATPHNDTYNSATERTRALPTGTARDTRTTATDRVGGR